MAIPKVNVAIITGSASWGLAFPEDVPVAGVTLLKRDIVFDTPYGQSENWKLLEFSADRTPSGEPEQVLCMYQHGNPRDRIDHSCHQRAFWVLMEAGVQRVLSMSTIGALNKAIMPGDMVINSDIIELTQTPLSLLPGRQRFDCSGKQLVCATCAALLEETARQHWPSGLRVHGIESGLVAAHAYGPRLTSPAEVIAYHSMGADVINHSLAPEVTLSREIGACFVPLAFVTAGFNDYMSRSSGKLLREDVLPSLSTTASRVALETTFKLLGVTSCSCQRLKSSQAPAHYEHF
jgi:5'-methylthioadenosine phosphorylase